VLVRVVGGTKAHALRDKGVDACQRAPRTAHEHAEIEALGEREELGSGRSDGADDHRSILDERDEPHFAGSLAGAARKGCGVLLARDGRTRARGAVAPRAVLLVLRGTRLVRERFGSSRTLRGIRRVVAAGEG